MAPRQARAHHPRQALAPVVRQVLALNIQKILRHKSSIRIKNTFLRPKAVAAAQALLAKVVSAKVLQRQVAPQVRARHLQANLE